MSDTPKQSPLGINTLVGLIQNKGLCINQATAKLTGSSNSVANYVPGDLVNNTCLRLLTYAIRDAWVNRSSKVNSATYYNLYNIGSREFLNNDTVAALGNSKPESYTWTGWPNWNPYNTSTELTSWGFVRLPALQGHNEFNYNNSLPDYKDFLSYFNEVYNFINKANSRIRLFNNAKKFGDRSFNGMDQLISADITGVSKSTRLFGQDLINLGNAMSFATIGVFGLPSRLLRVMNDRRAITDHIRELLEVEGINPALLTRILEPSYNPSALNERTIYEAMTKMTDAMLTDILFLLNCKTAGINSVADLIDIKKIFPNSYQTLTVPVYSTNSGPLVKSYYLIYVDGAINASITSDDMNAQIGTKIIEGLFESGIINENVIAYKPHTGFGSYLKTILPEDVAVAAGAFSASMCQIKNIEKIQIEKFGEVVYNLETANGLTKVAESTTPVDLVNLDTHLSTLATGSGPYGTFTMSDFLGCVSGIPYNWLGIKKLLNEVETSALTKIYKALYLAVTWENATATITYEVRTRQTRLWSQGYAEQTVPTFIAAVPEVLAEYEYDWRVTSIQLVSKGGGYGRGDVSPIPVPSTIGPAKAPLVTITGGSGAIATTQIDYDDTHVPGDFGRVITLTLNDPGTWVHYATQTGFSAGILPAGSPAGSPPNPPGVPAVSSPPTIQIESPPTTIAGGSNSPYNTTGWPTMNGIVQAYIDQANQEIQLINRTNGTRCLELNKLWYEAGKQLHVEQQAISNNISIPIPGTGTSYAISPDEQYQFVDLMMQYALDQRPGMAGPTLECIADISTYEGQSMIGVGRETRNQIRISELGLSLSNNIPEAMPGIRDKMWMASGAIPNIPVLPVGTYDPLTDTYKLHGENIPEPAPGTIVSRQNTISHSLDGRFASGLHLPATYSPDDAVKSAR